MGVFLTALSTVFFPQKTCDLRGETVKTTGRLPRMLPFVFREVCWTNLPVLQSRCLTARPYRRFWGPHDLSFTQNYPMIHYFWAQFLTNTFILYPPEKTDWLSQKWNGCSGETGDCSRKLSENSWNHFSEEVCRCFRQSRRVKTRTFGLKYSSHNRLVDDSVNPFRTAVPFWGQTTWNFEWFVPKTGLHL